VTIDEIAADLPNGLHDSLLRTFSSNPNQRRAELVLDVWLGDLHSHATTERERYRPARLELLGLTYFVVEEPDPRYLSGDVSPVLIDLCAADDDPARSRQVPEGAFSGRFFVNDWNSSIHFAALDARLTWLETN
jgi:hypothetical protein